MTAREYIDGYLDFEGHRLAYSSYPPVERGYISLERPDLRSPRVLFYERQSDSFNCAGYKPQPGLYINNDSLSLSLSLSLLFVSFFVCLWVTGVHRKLEYAQPNKNIKMYFSLKGTFASIL